MYTEQECEINFNAGAAAAQASYCRRMYEKLSAHHQDAIDEGHEGLGRDWWALLAKEQRKAAEYAAEARRLMGV